MINGKKEFGKWLREQLAERKLLQKDLAAAAKINHRTVSHWCNGINYPDVDYYVVIDDFLHKQRGFTERLIEKYKKKENSVSVNNYFAVSDTVSFIREETKEYIANSNGGIKENEDVDLEKEISQYREELIDKFKQADGYLPPRFMEKLDAVSELDIYVYLFLKSNCPQFGFEEYVDRFVLSPREKRLMAYTSKLNLGKDKK